MKHGLTLLSLSVVLAACDPPPRPPRTAQEEQRELLVRAGTAPPEPGRSQWGATTVSETAAPPPQPETTVSATGEIIEGRASYYSDRLAGHRTASGEPYDPAALTAASRDLPLGTHVRVTRIDTGVSVEVRVNDRGPFGDHTRVLDLSRGAAERLDMIRAGVVSVRVEVLED